MKSFTVSISVLLLLIMMMSNAFSAQAADRHAVGNHDQKNHELTIDVTSDLLMNLEGKELPDIQGHIRNLVSTAVSKKEIVGGNTRNLSGGEAFGKNPFSQECREFRPYFTEPVPTLINDLDLESLGYNVTDLGNYVDAYLAFFFVVLYAFSEVDGSGRRRLTAKDPCACKCGGDDDDDDDCEPAAPAPATAAPADPARRMLDAGASSMVKHFGGSRMLATRKLVFEQCDVSDLNNIYCDLESAVDPCDDAISSAKWVKIKVVLRDYENNRITTVDNVGVCMSDDCDASDLFGVYSSSVVSFEQVKESKSKKGKSSL